MYVAVAPRPLPLLIIVIKERTFAVLNNQQQGFFSHWSSLCNASSVHRSSLYTLTYPGSIPWQCPYHAVAGAQKAPAKVVCVPRGAHLVPNATLEAAVQTRLVSIHVIIPYSGSFSWDHPLTDGIHRNLFGRPPCAYHRRGYQGALRCFGGTSVSHY